MAVIEALGERLVRVKGFVRVAGARRRGFIEKAGARVELRWEDGEAARSEIVLIGDDLDEGALRRALWACRSGGG
jgi:cobalamin biosynthesis protein CobW